MIDLKQDGLCFFLSWTDHTWSYSCE